MTAPRQILTMEKFLNRLVVLGGKVDDVYYRFGIPHTNGHIRKILSYDERRAKLLAIDTVRNRGITPDWSFVKARYYMTLSEYDGKEEVRPRNTVFPPRRKILLTLESIED